MKTPTPEERASELMVSLFGHRWDDDPEEHQDKWLAAAAAIREAEAAGYNRAREQAATTVVSVRPDLDVSPALRKLTAAAIRTMRDED